MRLKDKIAIVTGGGQGIGHGIARMFIREGAKVVIAQRTEETLERMKREITEMGGDALILTVDVRKEEDVERMIDATRERFGGLDVLVNNAGIGLRGPVDEMDMADYDRMMDTNLRGMYLGCRFAVPLMKERGKGAIINISSVFGVDGGPRHTAYAATKAGIIGCTRALAAELAPFYIRANTISPGAIDVEANTMRLLSGIRKEFHEEFLRHFRDRLDDDNRYFQPLEIIGIPEDIAYCAVYLASDESRFVTGQNIVVDGGLTGYLSPYASENARKWQSGSRDEMAEWINAHAEETD